MSLTFTKGNQTRTLTLSELREQGASLLQQGWVPSSDFSAPGAIVTNVNGQDVLQPVQFNAARIQQFLTSGGVEGSSERFVLGSPEVARNLFTSGQAQGLEEATETVGSLGAAGLNFAGGATLGMFNQATGATSNDPVVRATEERFGEAATGGRVLGELLPLFVGAPTSAAGLGAFAGRAVGARASGRAASFLAEGVVEGAAAGFTDAMLADETNASQLTERIFAGGGLGLLLGGGMAAIGRGASSIGRASREALEQGRSASQGSRNRIIDALDEFGGGAQLREFTDDDFIRFQQYQTRPGLFVRNQVDSLNALGQEVDTAVARLADLSAESLARRIDGVDLAASKAAAQGLLGQVRRSSRELVNSVSTGAAPSLRRAQRVVDDLDEFVTRNPKNNVAVIQRAEKGADELRRIRDKIPEGDAGRTSVDAIISGYDSVVDTLQGGSPLLRERREALRTLETTRRQLKNSFGVDTFEPAQLETAIRRLIDKGDRGALTKFTDLTEAAETAYRILGDVEGSSRIAALTSNLASAADELGSMATIQQVMEGIRRRGALPSLGGLSGFGIAGALFGGPVGASLGYGLGLLGGVARMRFFTPVQYFMAKANIKRVLGLQTQRATRGIKQAEEALASSSASPKNFKKNYRKLSPTVGTIAHTLLQKSPNDRRKLYDELVDSIERIAADPALLAETAGKDLEGVGQLNPALPREVGMSLNTAMSVLLRESSGRRGRRSRVNGLSMDIPASQIEVDEFLRTAAVVEDPFFGIEMLGAGQMTQRAGRAMRQVYPNIHSQVVQRLLTTIAERKAQGRPVNYQASLHFSSMLGVPLDATMEPEFINRMQSQSAQTSMQEQTQFDRPVSTRRATSLTDSHQTPSQRLIQ